jgi:hypothetical protein
MYIVSMTVSTYLILHGMSAGISMLLAQIQRGGSEKHHDQSFESMPAFLELVLMLLLELFQGYRYL